MTDSNDFISLPGCMCSCKQKTEKISHCFPGVLMGLYYKLKEMKPSLEIVSDFVSNE
jgi:hypothetical protein